MRVLVLYVLHVYYSDSHQIKSVNSWGCVPQPKLLYLVANVSIHLKYCVVHVSGLLVNCLIGYWIIAQR